MAIRVDAIHASQHQSPLDLDSASKTESVWRSQAFQGMLANIIKTFPSSSLEPQKSVAPYTVKKGDTLSEICESALKRAGKSASPSNVDTATKNVARMNKIANMNVILVGQLIDLSSLVAPSAQTVSLPAASSAPHAVSVSAASSAHAVAVPVASSAPHADSVPVTSSAHTVAVPAQEFTTAKTSPDMRTDLSQLIQSMIEKRADTKTSQPAKGLQPLVASPVKAFHTGDQVLEQTPDIRSRFGVRKNPFTGRSEQHSGVDLAVPSGTPVHALKSGTVTLSGWQSGYGKVVVVRHDDGTETFYAHNAKNLVIPGQQVNELTQIAQVGTTGRSTGPHLHFEVRRDGKPIDPMPFLSVSSFQIAKAS